MVLVLGSQGSGRQDALKPPTGGPGRPAPSFLMPQGVTGTSQGIRPPAELPGDQRPGGPRPVARPTQPTITKPPFVGPGGVQAPGAIPGAPQPQQPPTAPPQPAPVAPAPPAPPQQPVPVPAQPTAPTQPTPPPFEFAPAITPSQSPVGMPGTGIPLPAAPTGPPPPTLGGNPLVPQGQDAVPLSKLGGLLERQLANPSRFGSQEVQDAFAALSGNLNEQAAEAANRSRVGAAQRGVTFGTGGLREEQRARRPFERAQGDLATQLLLAQAATGGQDLNSAIGNAFRFGENEQAAERFAADLGLRTAGLGFGGAPDINSAIAALAGQPLPSPGGGLGDSFGALGSLAGLFRPNAGAPQAPAQPGGGGSVGVNLAGGLSGPPPPQTPPGVNLGGGLSEGAGPAAGPGVNVNDPFAVTLDNRMSLPPNATGGPAPAPSARQNFQDLTPEQRREVLSRLVSF